MKVWRSFISVLPFGLWMLVLSSVQSAGFSPSPDEEATNSRMFLATGVVKALDGDNLKIVIRHEAISNYMAAMTMPFKVKEKKELAALHPGDEILFRLNVAEMESWVDQIRKIGTVSLPTNEMLVAAQPADTHAIRSAHPLLDYKFTNELGQAVSLNDFRGQALAITFFYTRCPLPEYCPRLSKNFQEAQQKLCAMSNAPANWHLLSVSFDPQFDSPLMLKAYGESYHYDPAHWSFLTGPPDKIGELARQSGVVYESDGNTINHNFCTLIVNASGHLQTMFPVSGDLSDAIVNEIVKAAAVTNRPASTDQTR
jgi:protein SCO1/2